MTQWSITAPVISDSLRYCDRQLAAGGSRKITSLGRMGLPCRAEPSGAAGRMKTCRFQLCSRLTALSRSASSRLAMLSQESPLAGRMDRLTEARSAWLIMLFFLRVFEPLTQLYRPCGCDRRVAAEVALEINVVSSDHRRIQASGKEVECTDLAREFSPLPAYSALSVQSPDPLR